MQLTQAIIADHLDLSQPAVAKLLARLGIIDLGNASIDMIRVEYIRSLRTAAAGRDGHSDIAGERLRLTAAKRFAAEMQNEREVGTLCRADDVRSALTTIAAHTRQALERIPDRIALRLTVETDETAVHRLLAAEIEQVLTDMAASLRQWAAGQVREAD